MGAVLGSLSESFAPKAPIYLSGRATKVSPSGIRVCVSASHGTKPKGRTREICAVSPRSGRRAACGDACRTACDALPDRIPGIRRARAICRRDCAPACDQPERVAVATFERVVGGINGE